MKCLPLAKVLEDFDAGETAVLLVLLIPLVETGKVIFRLAPERDALLADGIVCITINFRVWSDSEMVTDENEIENAN